MPSNTKSEGSQNIKTLILGSSLHREEGGDVLHYRRRLTARLGGEDTSIQSDLLDTIECDLRRLTDIRNDLARRAKTEGYSIDYKLDSELLMQSGTEIVRLITKDTDLDGVEIEFSVQDASPESSWFSRFSKKEDTKSAYAFIKKISRGYTEIPDAGTFRTKWPGTSPAAIKSFLSRKEVESEQDEAQDWTERGRQK